MTVPRDGNCGYNSILCIIYNMVRCPKTTLHHLFLDVSKLIVCIENENYSKSTLPNPSIISESEFMTLRNQVIEILNEVEDFDRLLYAQACILVHWLRLHIGAYIISNSHDIVDPSIAEDPIQYARNVVSQNKNAWLRHPELCFIAEIFKLHIVCICIVGNSVYRLNIGEEIGRIPVVLLNTDNRHFEPVLFYNKGFINWPSK